ncbi:phosphopantetheine-binding protein [Streptomyces goshikiensis]|uniref:phosphopantetheine-binding protein n=1 Tax=Streptomyces goshikiensis TaxID=1942 RepID=UPI003686F08A
MDSSTAPYDTAADAPELSAAAAVVVDIWADVLEIEPGLIDAESSDFFELGGYSLLALQSIGRLLAAHGIDQDSALELEGLLLNQLFEQPTASAQAACLIANLQR